MDEENRMYDDQELAAMAEIARVLSGFGKTEHETVDRVLRWACERFGVQSPPKAQAGPVPAATEQTASGTSSSGGSFEHLADAIAAAQPKTDPDRVLVAAWWLAEQNGTPEFKAQDVNRALKNLGHGIANITVCLSTLIKRPSPPVVQIKKTGKSRQARKTYKVTQEAGNAVRRMMQSEGGE